MTRKYRSLSTLAAVAVSVVALVAVSGTSLASASPLGKPTLRPAACSPGVTSNVTVMGSWVSKAFEAFNLGNAKKTEPYMRKAIAAARKARTAASSESTKQLLTAFIDIGADKYRVSLMRDALLAVEDNVNAGC
ncbi:MAG: hypothetical protein ACKOW5_07535 [Actinomycetales bacterium]